MRKDRWLGAVVVGALALVLALLVVVLVQLHRVEARFAAQGQQLRALGDATDRLMAGGVRTRTGSEPAAADDIPPGVKLRHPDAANFLKPADTRWPAEGASLDGVFMRGWSSGDPKGFNPLLENSAYNTEFIEVYASQTLAYPNAWTNPDAWHGDLAWRIELTDDAKTFTCYLRQGARWHRPANLNLEDPRYAWLKAEQRVTAHDFVFAVEMILNPQVEVGPIRNYYADVESAKALDDFTFELKWKTKQFINIEQTLALFPMPKFLFANDENGQPLPKETVGLRFNQHWYNNKGFVGSGPYQMESYTPGSKMVFVRNEAFEGPKPAIKSLVYPIYTDPTQTLLKLKAHELTFGELRPMQYREEIEKYESSPTKPQDSPFFNGSIQCEKINDAAYRYVGWNADRPFFADKRVRRAMTHAFDRERILANVFVGLGTLITGPYPPEASYNDPKVKQIPYDLEAAKRLLAEAGWADSDGDGLLDRSLRPGEPRKPFQFTFVIPASSNETSAMANIIRDDLLKIGVKMMIESAEWSLFLKRMDEKNFDAYAAAWTVGWNPDLYQIWHSTQADVPKGSNRVGFRNKEADRIIETLRVTFDLEERKRLLQAFHRIVDDEQPYSFFSAKKAVACWWKEVKDVKFSKMFPTINALPWSMTRAP